MADNVIADPGAGGATFASDDIGGVQYPRTKICWGVDGIAFDTSAAAPLPVIQIASIPAGANNIGSVNVAAIAAGANNIGNVGIVTVPVPLSTTGGGVEAAALRVTVANDSTGVLSVDDNGGSLTIDGTITANAGLNLNTSLLALEAGGNLATIESRTPALGQALMGSSVPVVIASNQSAVNVAATLAAETVKVIGTVNVAAGQSITVTQGAGANLHMDLDSGTLTGITNVVHVDDNAGSLTIDGTVAATQSGNWAVRTQDGSGNALTSHLDGVARGLDVAILDGAGNQITAFGGGVQYAQGTNQPAPTGTVAMGKDGTDILKAIALDASGYQTVSVAAALPAGTNNIGDVDVLTVPAPLSVVGGGTEAAAMRVTIANDSTGLLSVDDNGGSLTVDGSVAISSGTITTVSTVTAVTAITNALPAGNNNIGDVDIASVPAPLNVVNGGAEAAALRVTIANDSTGLVSVDDNGGSLTVDGTVAVSTVPAPLNVVGGGTEAAALRVTLANDSTGLVSIDDNGGSLTVDGTVGAVQSGSWSIRMQDGSGNSLTSHLDGGSRGLDVAIIDGAGNQITSFGGGTQYTDGNTQATPIGTVALGKNPTNVLHALPLDAAGYLEVNVVAGGGTGGTSSADNSTFSSGSTSANPISARFDNVTPSLIAEDNVGVLRMSNNRNLYVQIRDSAGNERGLNIDAAGSISAAISSIAAGNNNIGDVDIASVPAPLNVVNGGVEATALRVTIANDSTGLVSIDDNGGSLTVDGSVTVVQPTGTNLHIVCDTPSFSVVGPTAADAAMTAAPVTVGGRGSDAVPSAMSAAGDVTNAWLGLRGERIVAVEPKAFGGLSNYHLVSGASTNAVVVKASPGVLYGWYIYNSNAAARKLALHNYPTTPTAGSLVFMTLPLPAGAAANVHMSAGITFSGGIGITTVTGLADNDTTAVAANDLIINLWYK